MEGLGVAHADDRGRLQAEPAAGGGLRARPARRHAGLRGSRGPGVGARGGQGRPAGGAADRQRPAGGLQPRHPPDRQVRADDARRRPERGPRREGHPGRPHERGDGRRRRPRLLPDARGHSPRHREGQGAGRGRRADEEPRAHRRCRHLRPHADGAHDGRVRDGGRRAQAGARPARLHARHRLSRRHQRAGGARAPHSRRLRPGVRPADLAALARSRRVDSRHDIPLHWPGNDRPVVGRHHGGPSVHRRRGAAGALSGHRPAGLSP